MNEGEFTGRQERTAENTCIPSPDTSLLSAPGCSLIGSTQRKAKVSRTGKLTIL